MSDELLTWIESDLVTELRRLRRLRQQADRSARLATALALIASMGHADQCNSHMVDSAKVGGESCGVCDCPVSYAKKALRGQNE